MTSKQKIIVESLAMDLKRVALGFYRGSNLMAERFKEEAFRREEELRKLQPDQHLQKLLEKCRKAFERPSDRTAEDALMYSVLFQNYSISKFK